MLQKNHKEIAGLFNASTTQEERLEIIRLIYKPLSGVSHQMVRDKVEDSLKSEFDKFNKQVYSETYQFTTIKGETID